MKYASSVILLLAFAISASKADFILKFIVETSEQTSEATIKRTFEATIKQTDTKQRADFPEYSVIQSCTTNEATMLLHTSKISLKLDNIRDIFATMNKLSGNSGTSGAGDFKPTGKTERINVYETRELTGNFGALPLSIFLTDNLPAEKSFENTMRNWLNCRPADAFDDFLAMSEKLAGFPIRIVTEYDGKKYVLTYESLKKANLDDREFAVPDDYTELSLSELPLSELLGH